MTDGRTNKSPPVLYRTSSPSGPLPKKLMEKFLRLFSKLCIINSCSHLNNFVKLCYYVTYFSCNCGTGHATIVLFNLFCFSYSIMLPAHLRVQRCSDSAVGRFLTVFRGTLSQIDMPNFVIQFDEVMISTTITELKTDALFRCVGP